jgi:type II secretory pathway pseudopilin PulG
MKIKSAEKTLWTRKKIEPLWVKSSFPSRPSRLRGSTLSGSPSSVSTLQLRNQQSEHRHSGGFTYIGLLAILIIIGISLGATGKYWQNVMLRDKEEELLFRGDQYKQAIERYYSAVPGKPQYPRRIEDLLQDGRTPVGKRHLRQKYKDPISGQDFVLLEGVDAAGKYIMGVHSPSDKAPLKQSNFPDAYQDFAGKGKYSDWQFLAVIQQTQQIPIRRRLRVTPQPNQ